MSEETQEVEEIQEEPVTKSKTQKKKEIRTLRTLGITTKAKSKDPIKTTICVMEGLDPTNEEPKLVVFRKSLVENQKNILNNMLQEVNDILGDPSTSPNDINISIGRKVRLEVEIDQLNDLLNSDYIEFVATWKYPSLKDLVDIDNRSLIDDGFGKNTFNEYENVKAKLEILLQSWTVTDIDDDGQAYIIPVKEALDCDPEILKSFVSELDVRLNNYTVKKKK